MLFIQFFFSVGVRKYNKNRKRKRSTYHNRLKQQHAREREFARLRKWGIDPHNEYIVHLRKKIPICMCIP